MKLLSELKRRHVFRVLVVYGLVAVGVVEAADLFFVRLGLPDWSVTFVVALVVVGFPVAAVLAWAYEVTPGGIRRDRGGERTGSNPPAGPAPAAAASSARPVDKSIAVLPFTDMSPEGDQEYFGDGIAEEIIDALTKLEDLGVAARTSSFAFRGRGEDVREIGRKLGVGAVLEGSIRKAGSRLRITAQLISVADGYHLWSERYDREMDDVFQIQDDIARAVVENLRVRLLGHRGSLVHTTTRDAEAYDLYLKGRWAWRRRYQLGLEAAMQHFRQAIALDPEFAEPYAGVADTYVVMAIYGFGDLDEVLRRAEEAVERARELGPEVPDVQFALGFYELVLGLNAPAAVSHFRHAIRLGGRHPRARGWLGVARLVQGHREEGLAAGRAAVEEAPDSTYILSVGGLVTLGAGELDEARELFRRVQEMEPTDLISRYGIGLIESLQGNHDAAIDHLRYVHERGGRAPTFAAFLAAALARAGRMEEAEELVAGLAAAEAPSGRLWMYAWAGHLDEAFAALDDMIDVRSPALLCSVFFPPFEPMRADPRWKRMEPFLHAG